MALSGRLAGRLFTLFRSSRTTSSRNPGRGFATIQLCLWTELRTPFTHSLQCQYKRAFTSSARWAITGQEAPSAKAYIESGVIGNQKKLVDVKKVLVIGSGGLSIGQAGEFDYSGEFNKVERPRFASGMDPHRTSIGTNWSCLADVQDPKH
jgi:carbamoyl-phosphate synthase large subunit